MPVTLAQAALNAASDIDRNVIDEFRKSSTIFDAITFDDVVNPAGGGATLTYGYTRLTTQPTAAFRAINAEYVPQEAGKTQYTVDLKVFGGSFQIDRVLDRIAAGAEVAFQIAQKAKAAKALFNDSFINGSAAGTDAFDGLKVALDETVQEIDAAELVATSGAWHTVDEAKSFAIMDDVDQLLALLDGPADMIIGNAKALARIRGAARRAGYFTRSENAFGQTVERYNGVLLVDPGQVAGGTTDVIPVDGNGLTEIYTVRLGLDGLHAISLAGVPPVRQWLPDFSTAGAVKTGEVEMVAAIALKSTKSAAMAHIDIKA